MAGSIVSKGRVGGVCKDTRSIGLPRGIVQLHTYGLPSNNAASRAEKI